MLRAFLPKEYNFYNYFERHSALTIKMTEEFLAFAKGEKDLETATQTIKEMERELDKITHECVDAIHRTFITPIERTDIHHLITRLDSIADNLNGAVKRINLYEAYELRPETIELADILVKSIKELHAAIKGLPNIKKAKEIEEHCELIHQLENMGDNVLQAAVSRLFKESDAVTIIKWREIFNQLEKAIDRCEDAAHIIEIIIISSS